MALDFPASPTIGQTFPGPGGIMWSWDGAKWGPGTSAGPPNGVLIAATPPTSPVGTLWWDSTGGQLYVYYNDGNSTAWVPASNIIGLANAATTMDVDKALNDVGRNLIHNSAFTIAQRGAGPFTISTAYAADRWKIVFNLDTNVSISPVLIGNTDRAAIGDEEAVTALSTGFTGNSGAAAVTQIQQPIENVRRLAGKTVCVSFWANSVSGLKLGINMLQVFGSGGSPSANVVVLATGASVTLSATFARYSVVISLPSVVGKTFGTTAGTDYSTLQFFLSSGANQNAQAGNIGVQSGTINIWGIQLEVVQPGQTVPTKLEKRDPVLELQQCQRFYCAMGALQFLGYTVAGGGFGYTLTFPTPMRAAPTIVFGSPTYTNASGITSAGPTTTGVIVYASAVATGNCIWFLSNMTASADL
jgi:hypothetical protein